MYADIAFPISSFQIFSYKIPSKFQSVLSVGSRVIAPLSGRKRQGIITSFSKEIDYKGQIKSISEVLDEKPVLSSELWSLINWLSDYYVTPKGQVAKVVLPKNLSLGYNPPSRWYVDVNQELNKKDLIEVPKTILETMEIIPVESVDEVLKIALTKPLKRVEWVEVDQISNKNKSKEELSTH